MLEPAFRPHLSGCGRCVPTVSTTALMNSRSTGTGGCWRAQLGATRSSRLGPELQKRTFSGGTMSTSPCTELCEPRVWKPETAGVQSTYFLWLHSDFYSVLERSTLDSVKEIVRLGHWIGLHFDADFYGGVDEEHAFASRLTAERELLGELAETPIDAVSFHNPTVGEMLRFDSETIAGMANAYSARIGRGVRICLGFQRILASRSTELLIDPGVTPRLHVLTHPEWWQDEPMSPRDRVVRCLDGRRVAALVAYDDLLERFSGGNIR